MCYLYIPHGSDERLLHLLILLILLPTLYPTWFRWKQSMLPVIKKIDKLYIPHGSDESIKKIVKKISLKNLYIPHGSDERNFIKIMFLFKKWLYIPHGSDESWVLSFNFLVSKGFISHMVQMKVLLLCLFLAHLLPLYPTWFRWKSSWCHLCTCIYCLYIPHGSDERSS